MILHIINCAKATDIFAALDIIGTITVGIYHKPKTKT